MNDAPVRSVEPDRITWRLNGRLHRTDGPAVEWPDGAVSWYAHGELHRFDGPAVAAPNGYLGWYVNGQQHRVDGPAATFDDGHEQWFLADKFVPKAMVEVFLTVAVENRELVAQLYGNGTPMIDAVAAANRLR